MYDDFDVVGPLEIDIEVEGPDTAIFLAGDLDLSSRRRFWTAFQATAAQAGGQLILDLSGLQFLDAAGLRALIDAQKLVGERLVVRTPSSAVRRILELTGFDQRLPLQLGAGKVAYVRSLWEAFSAGGARAMAELVPDQVEWLPWGSEGQVLRGSREMREFWASRTFTTPRQINFTQVGGDVVVHMELPLPDGPARELWSVYHFEGDQLIRAVTFADPGQALAFAA